MAYLHFEIKQRIVRRDNDQFAPGSPIPCTPPDSQLNQGTVITVRGRGGHR